MRLVRRFDECMWAAFAKQKVDGSNECLHREGCEENEAGGRRGRTEGGVGTLGDVA